MKIDQRLNLIIPIERENDVTLHVFHRPISTPVFEKYYLTLAKLFSEIYTQRLHLMGGPRIAAIMLRDIARNTMRNSDENWLDGPEGIEQGFFGELYRLTNILMPDDRGGWQTVMLADAAKRDYVSEDEFGEVEGMLAFFTVNSRLLRKEIWTSLLAEASNVWNVSTSLSDITAWRDSLPKSNQVETTEATPMNHLSGIR
jgi:hypothetical protein